MANWLDNFNDGEEPPVNYNSIPTGIIKPPKIVYTTSGSRYMPEEQTIYLNPEEDYYDPSIYQHEMFHHWQNLNDKLRKPDEYEGPLAKPSIVANEEAQMDYYNRRNVETKEEFDKLYKQFPVFRLTTPYLIYDKKVNPELYKNPKYAEGEAEEYQDYIKGGGTPAFMAKGGLIKRADGSYSRRGLWDNIRANRGSGRKPTAEMLRQERKIKKKEDGGWIDMYNAGSWVEDSSLPQPTTPSFYEAYPDKTLTNYQIGTDKALMYGGGGGVQPFITSDINQYNRRKQAYADSLNLYNNGERFAKLNFNLANNIVNEYNKNKHFWEPSAKLMTRKQSYDGSSGFSADIENRNDYSKSLIDQYNQIANYKWYDFFDRWPGIKPTHSYGSSTGLNTTDKTRGSFNKTGGSFNAITPGYKKPVQNVIFDNSAPKNKITKTVKSLHSFPVPPPKSIKKEEIEPITRKFDFSIDEDLKPIAPTPYVPDPVRKVMNPAFDFNIDFEPNRTKEAVVDQAGNPRYKYYNGDKVITEQEYNKLIEKKANGGLVMYGPGGKIDLHLNKKNTPKDNPRITPKGFLVQDPMGLIIGGAGFNYKANDNLNISPYAIGVGNQYFQKFPADYGIELNYPIGNINPSVRLGKNPGIGVSYKFNNGGPVMYNAGSTVWTNQDVSTIVGSNTPSSVTQNYRNTGSLNPNRYLIGGKDIIPTGMDYKTPAAGTYDYNKDIQPYHTMRLHAPDTTMMAKHGSYVKKHINSPRIYGSPVNPSGMSEGPTTQRGITFANGGLISKYADAGPVTGGNNPGGRTDLTYDAKNNVYYKPLADGTFYPVSQVTVNKDGVNKNVWTDSDEYKNMYGNLASYTYDAKTNEYIPQVNFKGVEVVADAPDTYNNYMLKKHRNDGLVGAMFGTPLDYVFSFPQAAATKLFSGKYQTPSEAMDIQNPYLATGVDIFADPSNLLGIGLLDDTGKLIKASRVLRNGFRDVAQGVSRRAVTDFAGNLASEATLGATALTKGGFKIGENLFKNIKAPKVVKDLSKAIDNSNMVLNEVAGELFQGAKNRKAIEKGNQWFKDWTTHPKTLDKIDTSIKNAVDVQNQVYNDEVIKAIEQLNNGTINQYQYDNIINGIELDYDFAIQHLNELEFQAKNFTNYAQEYPLINQIKENAQDYVDAVKGNFIEDHIHEGNAGVSYGHFNMPYPNYPSSPRDTKTWVSRRPSISFNYRKNTGIHENTHSWVTDYILKTTGQKNLILNNMTTEARAITKQWKDLRKQGFSSDEIAKTMGRDNAFKGYIGDETEMHARTMELREAFGLTPDDIVDENMATDMMETMKSNRNLISGQEQYLDAFGRDPKKMSNIFNGLWGAVPLVIGANMYNTPSTETQQKQADGGYVKNNNTNAWLDSYN